MNAEQLRAIALATEGHSFFLTGGIGTGKTTVLARIIKDLQSLQFQIQLSNFEKRKVTIEQSQV